MEGGAKEEVKVPLFVDIVLECMRSHGLLPVTFPDRQAASGNTFNSAPKSICAQDGERPQPASIQTGLLPIRLGKS